MRSQENLIEEQMLERLNYFAYGSNMNVQKMKKRGVAFSKRRVAHLSGYRLEFNKKANDNPLKGYANIVPDDSDLIEGVLYDIDVTSLPKLDKYEGYPEHYLKIPIRVLLPSNGQGVCTITYIANPKKIKDGLKPTKDYLKHLLAGEDVLSVNYLKRLQSIETLD